LTTHTPLAELIRPQDLSEFVGQDHIKNRIKSLIQGNKLPSILFFGPPGCGKSTLALLMAKTHSQNFLRLSAPESNVSELRKNMDNIDILILDEIHRFSKTQQDFFLPHLEAGNFILIATTTENPSFSVTKQLLSRMHVLKLRPLLAEQLQILGKKAQEKTGLQIPSKSLQILVNFSQGDARNLLNLLEYCGELSEDELQPDQLKEHLPEIIQKSDRDGDFHYEMTSALIKSIRGSDPDAALYYLAGLLEGGEDPRFICRRLILSASEDVGLADPQALSMAVSCYQAIDVTGMPEGFIPLAETVTYLALAPKSNSTYAAYLAAQKEIKQNGIQSVPLHLRNPSSTLQKEWGYGQGYLYPHVYPEAWVEQDYLPEGLTNRKFYQSKDQGQEPRLNLWLRKKLKNWKK